jgi:hypothetical protein
MVAFRASVRRQWQPVIVPALVLWLAATVITCIFVRPIDVAEYANYAHLALRAPLLHNLPAEYPAPALAVFLLPLVLGFSYPWAFAVLCGIFLLLLVTSYDGSGVPGLDIEAARRLIAYLALGAVVVLAGRYDIIAAAAGFWCVRAAGQGRWGRAWTWSCIGFAIKIFPVIFWPALLIAEWRQRGRVPISRLAWMAGSIGVIAGIPALLNRGSALNTLHYYLRRPTEIESIPSGLGLLVDWSHTQWVTSFHSQNVVNGATHPIAVILEILAALGCLWVWRAQIQGRLPFQAACLATLSMAVLGAKVLSPQYFIWLMPLWALYPFSKTWLLAAFLNLALFFYVVSVQNSSVIPAYPFEVSATLGLLARDLILGWGTWLWLRSVLVDRAPTEAVMVAAP